MLLLFVVKKEVICICDSNFVYFVHLHAGNIIALILFLSPVYVLVPKDSLILILILFKCVRTSNNDYFLINIFRPTFTIIWKKKSVEQFSAVPYLATLFNCGMWILYGLPWIHPHSFLVLTINGSGFIIELVYLMIFLTYSDKKKRKNVILIALAELAFIGVVALMVLTLVHSMKMRTTIIGSICMVGCFLMYASPLAVMVSATDITLFHVG